MKRVPAILPARPPPDTTHPYWNVSFLKEEERVGIFSVLQRDFDQIWDDMDVRVDAGYPIVIDEKTGELCWKRDNFVLDACASNYMNVDLIQLAMDKDRQMFRKRFYLRLGYSLQKYCELFCK